MSYPNIWKNIYGDIMDKLKVLSLFSGCGGFDMGVRGGFKFMGHYFNRNPFEITFANDIHPPACDTYDENGFCETCPIRSKTINTATGVLVGFY